MRVQTEGGATRTNTEARERPGGACFWCWRKDGELKYDRGFPYHQACKDYADKAWK